MCLSLAVTVHKWYTAYMERKEKSAEAKIFAEIRTAVLQYNMLKKGDHIVCGLSGGPDSVCLFFALYTMREEFGITLSAVHVNHKFRPGSAEADQKYVEDLCERLGVRCRSVVCDCGALAENLGITSEEAGRKVRYEAFDAEAEESAEILGKDSSQIKIAVAHNAEDQAETLLFRLLRGTGTDGLAGIERKRTSEKGYTIIRPILGLTRQQIEAYCKEMALSPRIDESNLVPIYTRNKIRLQLLPYLSENFNENIIEALNRLAMIAGEDKEYLWQQAEKYYQQTVVSKSLSEIAFDAVHLRAVPNAVRRRIMLKALAELGLSQDVGAVHLASADRLLLRGHTGKTAEFPYGYSAVMRYDRIIFQSGRFGDIADCGQIQSAGKSFPTLTMRVLSQEEWRRYQKERQGRDVKADRENEPESEGTFKNYAAFDYEIFCAEKGNVFPQLRRKRPGDFICLSVGTKKIQDLLVDSKVPREQRDSILFAAAGSEILWMIGADSGLCSIFPAKSRFTSKYQVTSTANQVLLLEIKI